MATNPAREPAYRSESTWRRHAAPLLLIFGIWCGIRIDDTGGWSGLALALALAVSVTAAVDLIVSEARR